MTPEEVVALAFGLNPAQVTDATSNQTVAEWDSLGHITLILELEDAFGISFSPEEALAMTSVRAIKQALRTRGKAW